MTWLALLMSDVGAYLPTPGWWLVRSALLAIFFFFTPRLTMAYFTRPQSASAAVKIVAPTAVPGDSTKASPKKGGLFHRSPLISVLICPTVFRLDATTM